MSVIAFKSLAEQSSTVQRRVQKRIDQKHGPRPAYQEALKAACADGAVDLYDKYCDLWAHWWGLL